MIWISVNVRPPLLSSSKRQKPRGGGWRRWWSGGLSLAIHGVMLIGWWNTSVPRPIAPKPLMKFQPIEWIERPVDWMESTPPDPPPESVQAHEAAPAVTDAPVERTPVRRTWSNDPTVKGPRAGDQLDATPSRAESAPDSSGPVSLRGLRSVSGSMLPHRPVGRPRLPPSEGDHRVVRRDPMTDTMGPRTEDRPPRSLAEAGFKQNARGHLVYRGDGFRATLLPDGRISFRDKIVAATRDPISGGRRVAIAGLAEAFIKSSGQQLHHQQKRRLLERTFELRLAIAVEYASQSIDRRLRSLYRELLTQWSDGAQSYAKRRAALFARWDECEEGLPMRLAGFESASTSAFDEVRQQAGEKARATIEAFIRRHLPRGTPHAYTEPELRRYNAQRRSKGRFAPYAE